LAETRGRVSGPSGAAAKLGIPSSTLESKIRSMNINKYRFKVSPESALLENATRVFHKLRKSAKRLPPGDARIRVF
jgi:hypothetical protein